MRGSEINHKPSNKKSCTGDCLSLRKLTMHRRGVGIGAIKNKNLAQVIMVLIHVLCKISSNVYSTTVAQTNVND
jgi:hypothetical protein